jgi:hypothetical protein
VLETLLLFGQVICEGPPIDPGLYGEESLLKASWGEQQRVKILDRVTSSFWLRLLWDIGCTRGTQFSVWSPLLWISLFVLYWQSSCLFELSVM